MVSAMSSPDPKNPQPTPDNPYPEPARPPDPPEEPPTREPPGVPPPSPDPIPMPGEPVQIPPDAPPEIPPQPRFPSPTARMRVGSAGACALVVAVAVSLLALSGPAAAQASDEGSARQADPCQAEPQVDQQGQAAANEQRETAGAVDDDELSEMLERCRGVLKPPPTGDKEIAEPPPDTGTTPIIPPGSLPEQPPK